LEVTWQRTNARPPWCWAQTWRTRTTGAERLKAGEPTEGPFRPVPTNGAGHRGAHVRRIYVTPAAKGGRGFSQTLAELRIRMACTRGGDKTGPRFLQEEQ
jgi:hypothetical protein